MTQSKIPLSPAEIDARIYSVFKVDTSIKSNDREISSRFQRATETPRSTLHTLKIVQSMASPHELQAHKTSYVRGATFAILKNQWEPQHAPELIRLVDWFISLRPSRTHTNYTNLLKNLVRAVSKKVPIPQQKINEWQIALPKAKAPSFKFSIKDDPNSVSILHRRVQQFNDNY